MKTGRTILIIVVAIVLFALTYIIIQLMKKPADSNTPPPAGPGSGGGNTGGGNTGGTNNNPPPVSSPITIGDKLAATGEINAYEKSLLSGSPYLIKKFKSGNYVGQITGQNSVEWIVLNYSYTCNTGDSYNYSTSSSNSNCVKNPNTLYVSKSGPIKKI